MKKNIRVKNAGWIVSAVALIALTAVANAKGMIVAALCMAVVSIVGMLLPGMRQFIATKNKKFDLLALLIVALAGVNFYSMWQPSSLVAGIAQHLGMTKNTFLALLAILGSAIAWYAIRCVLGALPTLKAVVKAESENGISCLETQRGIGMKEYLFLLSVAAAVITICSKSSPIYPFNDWVDSNCFFTVGKSMLHGKVLYRDIYEQKGFYLYILHAVAYMISPTSFFGVYLLEIAAAFAFLVFVYRIARLYSADVDMLYAVPIIAAIIYGAQAFCHGDSAEEFCLPILGYALWVGLKAIRNAAGPDRREYFLIGVTSGLVLWIKYTMLGFYLGWYAVIGYGLLKRREWKEVRNSLIWIALGVLCVSVPVLLYFGIHNALYDLWRAYFYNNMFLYSSASTVVQNHGMLENILIRIRDAAARDGLLAVMLVLAFVWHGITENRAGLKLMLGCAAGCMVVFSGKITQLYYALVFCVFAASALPSVYALCRLSKMDKRVFGWGGVILMLMLNNNTYMLMHKKQDLPQYAFKEIIEQVPQASLLNYGFLDGGFYTVCDIVPECKYFCKLNIKLEESDIEQDNCIEQGAVDFVVTRGNELESSLYECIAEKEFEFEEKMWKYRLYALKELSM